MLKTIGKIAQKNLTTSRIFSLLGKYSGVSSSDSAIALAQIEPAKQFSELSIEVARAEATARAGYWMMFDKPR